MDRSWVVRRKFGLLFIAGAVAMCGCQTVKTPEEKIAKSNIPRELSKVTQPEYVVEPPDILLVEVYEALPGQPIKGERLVRPDGTISLGWYGDIQVSGLTIEQIKEAVIAQLRKHLGDKALGLVRQDGDRLIPVEPRDSSRVFVDVSSYNSKVYYVQGEVGSPGRWRGAGHFRPRSWSAWPETS